MEFSGSAFIPPTPLGMCHSLQAVGLSLLDCPDLQLMTNHILECPTVATKLLKMGMVPLRDYLWKLLYSPDAPIIAQAVIKTFDGI
ncbi:hypothetical protein TNCV_3319051 [Trichonephila clavipes]|nr:hypothetical protein TNCV_3319051 [Trichonephila clavipes]